MVKVSTRSWTLLLFGAALGVRLLFFGISDANPIHSTDSLRYTDLAQSLYLSGQYSSTTGLPTAFRPPGYPLFMAGVFWVVQKDQTQWVIWVQILLSSASPILLLCVARRFFKFRVAFFGALILAFNPLNAHFASQVLSEAFFEFLFIAFLFLITSEKKNLKYLSGIVLGLCILTRPMALLFLPAILITFKSKARWIFIVILLCLSTLAPWIIRNSLLAGQYSFVSTNGGKNFIHGLNDRYLRSIGSQGMSFDENQFNHLDEWQRNRAQYHFGFKLMASDPWFFIRSTGRKWLHYGSPLLGHSYTNIQRILFCLFSIPFLIFGVIGLYRSNHTLKKLLVWIFLFQSLGYAIYFTNIRFRIPVVEASLGPFVVFSLFEIFSRLKKHGQGQLQ